MTAEPAQVQAQASRSSFYAGMRVLPKAEREAMFAVYAFCRAVDDIADDMGGPREDRRAALDAWRADIKSLYAGGEPGRAAIVAEAVERFGLGMGDFLAVIDGMQMDADEDIRAPGMATLDLYCDRVASAVGRLSVRVFGVEREAGIKLAHHLGRALQLTNILRDLDEDAAIGRLYLPREALQRAGIDTSDPKAALRGAKLPQVCAELVERAREHFVQADAIMAALPRKSVRAPRIMGLVYGTILDQLTARGFAPPRQPIRVSRARLLWIVLRHAVL